MCAKAECSSAVERHSREGTAGGGGKSGEANLWSWDSGQETAGNLCVWLHFRDLVAGGDLNETTPLLRVRNQSPLSPGADGPGRDPAQKALGREEVPRPLGKQPPGSDSDLVLLRLCPRSWRGHRAELA